jgi:uncharacterized linocin/CFP29 family protein
MNISNFQVIVGFRGTQGANLENWIHDLSSAEKVVYRGITELEVAEGFYTAYLSTISTQSFTNTSGIQQSVLTAVTELVNQNPTLPVVVVGHSLGAALSELCALDLIESCNGHFLL